MARPQVADGGNSLQIWRVAANILNKQSWISAGGPPAWGLSVGLTTPPRKKLSSYENSLKVYYDCVIIFVLFLAG
jgi:hypothetical protein